MRSIGVYHLTSLVKFWKHAGFWLVSVASQSKEKQEKVEFYIFLASQFVKSSKKNCSTNSPLLGLYYEVVRRL